MVTLATACCHRLSATRRKQSEMQSLEQPRNGHLIGACHLVCLFPPRSPRLIERRVECQMYPGAAGAIASLACGVSHGVALLGHETLE